MAISNDFIDDYYINVIRSDFIDGYWWLFYSWLLVVILLMVIWGYSINGYWWLLY
jgi:hypothetical protein